LGYIPYYKTQIKNIKLQIVYFHILRRKGILAVIADSPRAANVFGTLGACFWSIQLLPQIWMNYRRHSTEGFQPSFMLLWAIAGIPLGIFNIVENFNIPLWIQPQILSILSLITWGQCYYYGHQWKLQTCLIAVVGIALLFGGIETAGILSLSIVVRKHNIKWPMYIMSILSATLLSLGVLREYLQIYRHRTSDGISILFVILDAMGDLTSILSLLFEHQLDIWGLVIYSTELVLWIGIIIYYSIEHLCKSKQHIQTELEDTSNNSVT
jgi:uncharacterized protein with PQ loop repeat